MGKKIRAAKASLVAAFLAAGGAATAESVSANAAAPPRPTSGGSSLTWGDPLIRFLKLDGFPAYLKVRGSAQLAQFYKPQLLADVAMLYDKWRPQVDDLLALYHKANAGPLSGILIGLEQYNKNKNIEPLLGYLKTPGAMDAYIKFEDFFAALQKVGREGGAFEFFSKETGISGLPAVQTTGG